MRTWFWSDLAVAVGAGRRSEASRALNYSRKKVGLRSGIQFFPPVIILMGWNRSKINRLNLFSDQCVFVGRMKGTNWYNT